MITILVGDRTEYISVAAKKYSHDASLITEDNFRNISNGIYYISLGDFTSINNFTLALNSADKLIYCPPDRWSDTDSSNFSYMQKWTEFYLHAFNGYKKVEGIERTSNISNADAMLSLVDTRKVDSQQLWVAGCSVSIGDWLNPEDRYGQILSNKLKIPVSFLAQGGSSIKWAADQILRSDIRKDDVVIFGLTSACRFNYYQDKKVLHVNSSFYQSHPEFNNLINITTLDSENSIYQSIISVYQVINFCKAVGAKLILAGLLITEEELSHFASIPNYRHLNGFFGLNKDNKFIDFAYDNVHPGPLMHQWYADKILNFMTAK